MILVIVGTHTQGFERLVRAVDEYAATSDEKVIIQRGCSEYKPEFAVSFDWITNKEMDQLIQEARLVISHAGAGTIISVFTAGKPLIVAPRLKIYGENHNDHQLQLANALKKQNRVIVVSDFTRISLQEAIEDVVHLKTSKAEMNSLTKSLKEYLENRSNLKTMK